MISLQLEVYGFVLSLTAGMVIAALVDIFSLCRLVFARRLVLLLVMDLMAATAALVLMGLVLLLTGELRGYLFLGVGLGAAFYFATVGAALSRRIRLRVTTKLRWAIERQAKSSPPGKE